MKTEMKEIHELLSDKIENGGFISSSDEQAIKSFYTHFVAKAPHTVFSRASISKEVQNYLFKEVATLRYEKLSALTAADQSHRLRRKVAKAKMAIALGVTPKVNEKGATCSQVFEALNGKKLGIFKPNRSPSSLSKIVEFLGHLFGFTRQVDFCRCQNKLPEMYAEVASSIADEHFHFYLTPRTDVVELGGSKGSFMVWENHYKPAHAYKPLKSSDPAIEELKLFQKLAVFHYLLGHMDGHNENWLISIKNGRIAQIQAIDNSNAFLEKNPSERLRDFFAKTNQYKWKKHPLAKYGFETAVRKHVAEMITEQRLDEFISVLKKKFAGDPVGEQFISSEMIHHLHQRAAVLRKALEPVAKIPAAKNRPFDASCPGGGSSTFSSMSLPPPAEPACGFWQDNVKIIDFSRAGRFATGSLEHDFSPEKLGLLNTEEKIAAFLK